MKLEGALRKINQDLFPLDALPVSGIEVNKVLHSEYCSKVADSTSIATKLFGEVHESISCRCWNELSVYVQYGTNELEEIFGGLIKLTELAQKFNKTETVPSTVEDCVHELGALEDELRSLYEIDFMGENEVGIKWIQSFRDATKQKRETIREVLRGALKDEFLMGFVQEKVTPPSDKSLFSELHQVESAAQEQVKRLYTDGAITHAVYFRANWGLSLSVRQKAAFTVYSLDGEEVFGVPLAVALHCQQMANSTLASLPSDLSEEELSRGLDTARVLFKPYGDAREPYSQLENAVEAAFRL